MRPTGPLAVAAALGALALVVAPILRSSELPERRPVDADGSSSPAATSGTVQQVVDGDTIHLADGRRVRLVQIDAPEAYPRTDCWGAESRAALRARVGRGDEVRLAADPQLDDVDSYGRLLRYVEHDGELLNAWLVERGHAHPYFFRGERGRHAGELLAAARRARSEQRGLWAACPDARLDPERGA